MKNMRYGIIYLPMFLLTAHSMYGSDFNKKLQAIPRLMTDYRSYRDPEMYKNGVVEYEEVASYVKIRNLEHALEMQDLQAQLSLANHELFTYKTTTHVVAPALAVTIGFHTFLGRKEQQSQSCLAKAVGISLATSLFLIARSHLKLDSKSMLKNKNEIAKNNKQI